MSVFFVGWVEVTKPFDYAVAALRRPSGAAKSKCRASPTKLSAVGFRWKMSKSHYSLSWSFGTPIHLRTASKP